MTTADQIGTTLLGIYVALWVVGWVVFYPGRNVAFKRWLWPRYFLGATVLPALTATAAVFASGSVWGVVVFVLILPAAVSMLSCMWFCGMKFVRFCHQCGVPAVPRRPEPERFCMRCGADLDEKPVFDREWD